MKDLEERVEQLEKEVAELKRQLEERPMLKSTNYLVCEAATECLEIIRDKLHMGNLDAVILEMKRQHG